MTEHRPVGLIFWLKWILATTAGSILGLVGAAVALALPMFFLAFFSNFEALPLWLIVLASLGCGLGGVAMGIPIGNLQKLVLQRHVSEAGRWVRATVAGWTMSGLVVGVFSLALAWGH